MAPNSAELLAARLAAELEVQVPAARVLLLTREFLDLEPRLKFSDGTRPTPGLSTGSHFMPPAENLPADHAARLSACPPADAAGVIVFNTWVACGDRSWNNHAFTVDGTAPRFASIDYAAAFARSAAANPQISDVGDVQAAARNAWSEVEAALVRVEGMDDTAIDLAMASIPQELWSAGDRDAIASMLRSARTSIWAAVWKGSSHEAAHEIRPSTFRA